MIERADDVDAYIDALLDITDNNYVQAAIIVCKEEDTSAIFSIAVMTSCLVLGSQR